MSNILNRPFIIHNNLSNTEYIKDTVIFNNELSTITVYFDEKEIAKPDEEGLTMFQKYDTNILWDFGDGFTVYGKSATHSYKEPGIYYITCTCFDVNGNSHKNLYDISNTKVQVISVLDTSVIFTDRYCKKVRDGILDNIYAGEIVDAGEFLVKLDKDIIQNVPITCKCLNSKSKDIIDLSKNEQYTHLLPYHTFYDKDNNPCDHIIPNYMNVYMSLEINDPAHLYFVTDKFDNNSDEEMVSDSIIDVEPIGSNFITENEIPQNKLRLYILIDDPSLDFPKQPISLEHFSNSLFLSIETKYIYDINDILSENYVYVGKIGYSNVSFEEDMPTNNDNINLIYNLDQSYFPDYNIKLSKDNLNLVTIGIDLSINENRFNSSEITYDFVYSTNGLFSDPDKSDVNSINDNRFSFNRALYFSDNNVIGSQAVFRVRAYDNIKNIYYFPKDINLSISSAEILPIDSANIKINSNNVYEQYGSSFCVIYPKQECDNSAIIKITLKAKDKSNIISETEISLENLTYINLASFLDKNSTFYLDPKQNYKEFSTKDIWNVHKVHPSMQDIPNLDNFMLALLGSNNFLPKVINKGFNFVDDTANINTTSIKNLISLLESLNINIELYNNENFSSPHVISDIIKLISINHSRLIGTKVIKNDEFSFVNNVKGKNLGNKIELDQKIYINNDVYPFIIIFDKFTGNYHKVNSRTLTTAPINPFKSENNTKYFTIQDYRNYWGWNLKLKDKEIPYDPTDIDFELKNRKENNINIPKYYEFYEYISDNDEVRENSYISPSTLSENIINYDTWKKADGSIDRLLYKNLIETLGLESNLNTEENG